MAENASKTNESFLTITDLWRLCVARWRWFVVSVVICLMFAVRYIMTAPYLYSRSATIMVREDILGNNATDKNSKDFNDIGFIKQKSDVSDVVRHFTSLDVLMEVAKQMGDSISNGEAFLIAEGIQSRLSVESEGKDSKIINLTYQDSSTVEAERVLTIILKVYNEKWIQDKQKVIQSTSRFIDSKLQLLENELNVVDDSISSYKSRYGITEIENVSNIYLQQQSQADAEILKLMNQKSMAEYIRSLLEDEELQQLLLVNSGINNNLIESQITLYNSLLLQMQSHMEYTSGQNPLIINLEKELNSLRKNILANVKNHIRTIDIQLQTLEEYHELTTSKITSKPVQAKHLLSIEREQKVKESLYLYLLQKKEENEISFTYQSAPTRIIDIPHGGGKPTSPKRFKILLAAMFLGVLIPITLIFLRFTMDDSVRNRYDIERMDDIPFLGEVPLSERRSTVTFLLRLFRLKTASYPIVVSKNKQNSVNEAFRMIRTRLGGIHNNHPHQNVYMVTSSGEDVGKTFVAMNLALAFAIIRKRILFIDGDMRKRAASLRWNAPAQGLSDYLDGKATDLQSLFFQPKGYSTLDVLSAGSFQPNPTELLDSQRFGEMMEMLRPQYDIIIIDTPSSEVLADAEIIGRSADQFLFIVRAGCYDRRRLAELAAPAAHGKAQYVILNGVSEDK